MNKNVELLLICLIREILLPLYHELYLIMKIFCCFYVVEDPTGTNLLSERIYYCRWGELPEETVKSSETSPCHASTGCKSRLPLCFCNYINVPLRHRENWGSLDVCLWPNIMVKFLSSIFPFLSLFPSLNLSLLLIYFCLSVNGGRRQT